MTHPLRLQRLLVLLPTIIVSAQAQQDSFLHVKGKAQGTTYQISYRPAQGPIPSAVFDSILLSVDKSLSLYNSASLICAFNRSRTGIRADTHLQNVVTSALLYSNSSNGAFDITIKPVMDAWGFGMAEVGRIPTRRFTDSLKRTIGFRHLTIRNDSLLKDEPHIRIDCNGIAQGYTVDLLASYLIALGITDFLVELGGEIRLNGLNPEGLPWYVGIEDPRNGRLPVVAARIQPGTGAVTSSGNYRNIRSIEGQIIGHIMDPRTARPAIHRMLSVCVTASDAMTADAIDNTCMVLGVRKSLRLVRKFRGADIRIVYQNWYGRTKVKASKGFPHLQGS